jgi:hypothetical protein
VNAIVGVFIEGAEKAGALCARHLREAREQDKADRLTLFQIKRNKVRCTLCRYVRKLQLDSQ